MLRPFASVLGSGLVVNAATFAILVAAPLALPLASFARLSLAVAGVLFLVAVLDFGLSITSTRQYAATSEPAYLSLSIRTRLLLCALIAPPALVAFAWPAAQPYAGAALGAVALNLWNGLRAADQARQDFESFARSNLVFAAARLMFAGLGLATGSWIAVLIGLFVAPVVAIGAVKAHKIIALAAPSVGPVIGVAARYALWVFVSAACYNALMGLPMAIAGKRLDDVAIGTIGIAATFMGPVSLLNNALRLVLLPKVAAGASPMQNRISRMRLALALLLMAGAAGLAAFVGHEAYGGQFPLAGMVIGAMVGPLVFAIPIGLLNMDVHRQGAPRLEAMVNLARLCVIAPALWFAGQSLIGLSLAAGALLLLGELALLVALRWRNGRSVRSAL